ncbi:alpha/beta hydrolase [Paenibacillus sp. sgz500958]|uniref:alpha/beta hydrolase n=1 Tax=Paenibacillus sp. sgz500958 TaxID=3242475 RepID=UPI0036D429E7
MKTDLEQLERIKSFLKQTATKEVQTVEQTRKTMEEAVDRLPKLPGVHFESVWMGHCGGEQVYVGENTEGSTEKGILYFHGGGFTTGSSSIYRDLAARISQTSGITVVTVDYRLAPEHTYPAANEDCLNAYRWMRQLGYSASNLVLGGDSIGASLVLMTLITLRDAGEELPAGAFLLSPHTDLVNLDGDSYVSRADLDPSGSLAGNRKILEDYLGDYAAEIPALLSPLRLGLRGLPSMLIQAGDQEVLLSDATRFTESAHAAGVEVKLEVWENMWSVFQLMAALLPEARQAIANIGAFVRSSLNLPVEITYEKK